MINIMKILSRLGVVAVFLAILAGFIGYSRGYRFDFEKKSILPTGIIATSSSPRASKVYVNGVLKGVTDLNLTLPPDRYFIEVKKEGYSTWSKEISLKGELVIAAGDRIVRAFSNAASSAASEVTKLITDPENSRAGAVVKKLMDLAGSARVRVGARVVVSKTYPRDLSVFDVSVDAGQSSDDLIALNPQTLTKRISYYSKSLTYT
jgi:hypothetical protein